MKFNLIFYFLFAAMALNAQNAIGIRTGIFSAKHDYGYIGGGLSDNVLGIEAGAMARFHLFKGLFVQPEFTFIQKGGNKALIISNLDIKTSQIETAALLGYEFKYQNFSFFVNSGAFYGRIINKSTEGNLFTNLEYTENFDDDWDEGLIYGGGIGFSIGKGKLIFESRYRQSFNRFRVIAAGSSPESVSIAVPLKNQGWGFNLGYIMPIGKE